MKKSVKGRLCIFSALLFMFAAFAGCSSSIDVNDGEVNGGSGSKENTNSGVQNNPLVKTETSENKVDAVFAQWTFSDLGALAIEGAAADSAFSDETALKSSATAYTTFSAAKDKKYSIKSDVDYPASKGSLLAKIKSLGSSGKPIQYNKYEASTSCAVKGASAGALQIQDTAFEIPSVQGPFKIKICYSANSSKKDDGRYAFININGKESDSTAASAESPLEDKGTEFEASYTGSDAVPVLIGSAGPGTPFIRLYDVMVLKEVVQTTTVTTTTYADGSVVTVTKVTDEAGNVVSEKTETKEPVQDNPGSGNPDNENTDGQNPAVNPPATDPTATPEYQNGVKLGRRSKLNEINTADIAKVMYVTTAAELEAAITQVEAGGAIVLKAGTYAFDHQLTIKLGNNGSAKAMKYMLPEKGSKVTLDFSSQTYSNDTSKNARGLQMEGDYWHVYGLTVYGSADNGIFVAGKHNIVERCILQANRDTGLQISRRSSTVANFADWPSDNLILNCTAFDNHDPATDENADGFASKLTCGNGNVFDGCIAYCNSDDGWDLYAKEATGSIGVVTIRNCVAFGNGKLTEGSAFANGDMNGFKLGGSNGKVPTAHVIYNCLAFGNGHDGFTDNGNGGELQLTACTAFGNAKTNFNFYRTNKGSFYKLISANAPSSGSERFATDASPSTIEKVLFFNSGKYYYAGEKTSVTKSNCKVGDVVSNPYQAEFIAASAPVADKNVDAKCRNADGTVNMGGYLETKDSSAYKELGARFCSEAYEVLDLTLQMK